MHLQDKRVGRLILNAKRRPVFRDCECLCCIRGSSQSQRRSSLGHCPLAPKFPANVSILLIGIAEVDSCTADGSRSHRPAVRLIEELVPFIQLRSCKGRPVSSVTHCPRQLFSTPDPGTGSTSIPAVPIHGGHVTRLDPLTCQQRVNVCNTLFKLL